LLILSDWVNRRQQEIIEFQNAQNRALMKKMGPSWNSLPNDQGSLLAPKGKARGRKTLTHLTTIVTPDTIPRWHRRLIAAKLDYRDHRAIVPGRPPVPDGVARLILQFARETPTWGDDRIQGALANLRHEISDSTVGNILKQNGVEPTPRSSCCRPEVQI